MTSSLRATRLSDRLDAAYTRSFSFPNTGGPAIARTIGSSAAVQPPPQSFSG